MKNKYLFHADSTVFKALFLSVLGVGWIWVYHDKQNITVVAKSQLTPTMQNKFSFQDKSAKSTKRIVQPIELNAVVTNVNENLGAPVLKYENVDSLASLSINAQALLLTDGRPRVSEKISNIINQAVMQFSSQHRRNQVILEATADIPEKHLHAIERYFQAYKNWRMVRRPIENSNNELRIKIEERR